MIKLSEVDIKYLLFGANLTIITFKLGILDTMILSLSIIIPH